ncbi:MAG: MFS transporter [Ignavibacteriales bacterium]
MQSSLKLNLFKIYLFKFFVGFHLFAGVLIPFFTDWGKISFTQIMILQSWYMFWIFVFEIPTGAVADYLGRKQSLIIGCFAILLGITFYSLIPNFYLFLLGEFFWALSSALFSGADSALVYDTLKKYGREEDSKKVMGRIDSIFLVSIAISSPIGSIIGATLDLRMPTLLMLIPFSLALITALTMEEPVFKQEIKKRKYSEIVKVSVKILSRNRVLKILAVDMIFIQIMGYFMFWLQQPMLKQSGINMAYWGFSQVAFVMSQVIVMSNYTFLEKILGSKKNLIFYGSLIGGLAYILGALNHSVPATLISIYLIGGFLVTRKTLMISYMNKYIPSSERATVLSTISMINSLALAVINPLFGYFAQVSLNSTLLVIGIATTIFAFVSKVEEEHLIEESAENEEIANCKV